MGEYVAEYVYGFIGHPIIPGYAGSTDIQFRTEMERLVVGGEFRDDDVQSGDRGAIRVDLVLYGPPCACRVVGRFQLRCPADFNGTGRIRRT